MFHVAGIQALVPPERLLLWDPQDGREPLCKFPDLPVPNLPMPPVNESEDWVDNLNTNQLIFWDMRMIVRKALLLGSFGTLIWTNWRTIATYSRDLIARHL